MQDVKSAIDELEHAVTMLGLKGAELDTNVNGEQWDEPKFLPFFKAAEADGRGAVLPPAAAEQLPARAHSPPRAFNSLGVILDDAIVDRGAHLGGVLEACPDLRVCIAHGGGPACYRDGAARPRLGGASRGRAPPSRRARISAVFTTTP